jgi:peptide/nickel transport system substrate-binding protein
MVRRHTRFASLATATVTAVVVAGCGGGGSKSTTSAGETNAPVRNGGTLRVALDNPPTGQLDPALLASDEAAEVLMQMCEGLYSVDQKGAAVPKLAVGAPQVSADGRTMTIKVRTGIKFNDGTPFDAAAVKVNLARAAKKSALFPRVKVTSIDTPAQDSVVVHLATPSAPLINALTGPVGEIASPTQLKKLGDKFGTDPVCVGPFSFVKRGSDDTVELKRSTYYYDQASIHLDGMTFRPIVDDSARMLAVRSGDIDVADSPPAEQIPALKGNSAVRVAVTQGIGWRGLVVNMANSNGLGKPRKPRDTPMATSQAVRQAFAAAIDRDALIKILGNGTNGDRVSCSPIPPFNPLYDNPPCPKRDVNKARELLAQAGVKTPVTTRFLAFSNPEELRLTQAIQGMVREAGINLKIEPCDQSTCVTRYFAGNWDTAFGGFAGAGDADVNISPFLTSTGGFNASGYSDPKVDELIAKGQAEFKDVTRRKDDYKQALDIIRNDASTIFLYSEGRSLVARSNVSGYLLTPADATFFTKAGFTAKT